MSGMVQIAPDKSAQLNSKQDQTLLSRRCFTPISDEKKRPQLLSSRTAGQCGAGVQPLLCVFWVPPF